MSVLERLRDVRRPHWRGDVDALYTAISNGRRRAIIQAIDDGPLTIGELAERMALDEYGPPLTSDKRRRVYISLYQTHIKKLTKAGITVWDDPELAKGPNHAAALAAIEAAEEVVA